MLTSSPRAAPTASRTRPGRRNPITPSRKGPGPTGSRRAASAAATATATAPSTASGWVWVTRALTTASRAARPGSSAYQAPSGATRIAAPLPKEPDPPNSPAASVRQSPPSRTRPSSRPVAAP